MGVDKPTIVVVDDEEDITSYLSAALSDEGFEVLCAADGRRGLELVHRHRPDLVCLDLLMPESTGLRLYQAMRGDPTYAGIPVIIVSGLGVGQALDQMLAGLPRPEVYLEKPIVLEPFMEAVHRLVNGREGS